jgi:hypothetical protein
MRLARRIAAWLLGIPVALMAAIYLVLLVTPLPLPFLNSQVRNLVEASMPEGSRIELGDMALALEGYVWPVIQFRPVAYTDARSGARIEMDALEVGFSPIRALWGQPGASVTVVGPHIQVNQDLFGPRLVTFNLVPDPDGGADVVQIIEGEDAFPDVDFSAEGVELQGDLPPSAMQMRSDNDWIVFNLEAAEKGISTIIEQANLGRFSRMIVRNATLDMNDAVYGIFRTFRDINLDIAPSPDGRVVGGTFSANFDGAVMNGTLERTLSADGKTATLATAVTNLNLGAFVPFESASVVSLVGAGAVSAEVNFDVPTGKIRDGVFHMDLTGMDVRVENDFIPLATGIMEVKWEPDIGQFTMAETQISLGTSTGYMSGVFRMGLDELYGPVVNMSVQARDVSIIQSDLGPPEAPFSKISFQSWSAPLYGATGIDGFRAEKADGSWLSSRGRIDMLVRGMGIDMTVEGDGISADDLKRLWPYFVAPEGRDWFVKNIVGGKLGRSAMRYSFPVGTMARPGENKPLPKNSIFIDLVGVGVQVVPMPGMAPVTIEGETRLSMQDADLTISADGATVTNDGGSIAVANVGFTMTSDTPGESIFELSGDLAGSIPALVTLAKEQAPDLLKSTEMPMDIAALNGNLSLSLVSTTVIGADNELKRQDYVANGVIQDFGSTAPFDGHTIGNGQLSFVASQQGYRVQGQAEIDGLAADVVISGTMAKDAPPPEMLLSATLDADDLKKMGFDASEFMQGSIKFVAKPMPDRSLQMAVDVTDATVTLNDLGITKARGVKGAMQALIRQDGDLTEISEIDIAFGDVKLEGSMGFDTKKNELQRAEFTSFALSPGDVAQLSLTPIRGGYQLRIRGDQLDLKPMLKRFFSLEEGSTGGPQAAAFENTTLALDIELKRALGFFRTTAFNLDIDLALRGTDIQKASLSAQFGGNSALSVTSNPTPNGKVLSVVFNDLGTVLRLMGVYPNIEGGSGSLVLNTVTADKADYGTFLLKDFAIVDEDNLAQVVGNDRESRARISRSNKMEFKSGEVQFVRRKDRIEITDGVLAGNEVGGSARGFIYTDKRQYDIVGTYVPLFGLNNVFAKLMGPLAGRDGEGLFGITFQVRGPLDKPDFRVNPMSALAPGVFRRMFEFRQREIPRVE